MTAQVRLIAGSVMKEESRSSLGRVVVLSLCVGLFYGLLEAVLLLSLYDFSRLAMWQNGVSARILWVGPVVDGALFLFVGLCLAGVFALVRRTDERWTWPLSFGVLAGTAAFGLTMSPRNLIWWGCAVFATGVGVASFRWAQKREPPRSFWSRLLPVLIIIVVLAGLGTETFARRRERQFLASLPVPRGGQPNVLVIVLDTLRADHLSAYGYTRHTSPNLDRFAAEGLLFEKAVSAWPSSPPSHLAIMSARRIPGGWYRAARRQGYFRPLLSETLAQQGYASVACIANNMWVTPKIGLDHGFSRFNLYFHNFADSVGRVFYGKMLVDLITWGSYYDQPERKRPAEVNRELLTWIDQTRSTGRPFFALLNYMDMHAPYWPPSPFTTKYSPRVTRKNMLALYDWFDVRKDLTDEEKQSIVDAYDASLVYLDHSLGELRLELEKRGLLDQTLIIITADHGESLGEGNYFGHDRPILRQEYVRVPLILRYPPKIAPGVRGRKPVSLRQIPATVADVLGISAPYDGPSLLASAAGHEEPAYSDVGGAATIFSGSWHYVLYRDGRAQLYNIDSDPHETQNLHGRPDAAAVESELRGQLVATTPDLLR